MLDPWVILWAWLALHSPVPGDNLIAKECLPGFDVAIHQIAIKEELMSKDEAYYSLDTLRDYEQRLRDAPPYWCVQVQPSYAYLEEQLAFAYNHMEWLEGQIDLYGMKQYGEWYNDVERRQSAYSNLSLAVFYAKHKSGMINVRENLKYARDILGEDAIRTGVLPPIVPLNYFKRIR